ncbi:MAG: MBL fold metallo-hydrolase [bacterium]
MKLKFWGVRGSIPVPQREMIDMGGNTSCIEIWTCDDELIILDSGTGIRGLGKSLLQRGERIKGNILLSHTHWDHIQGFPFFAPAFIPGNEFTIYGAERYGKRLEDTMAGQMEYEYFPVEIDKMGASIKFRGLKEGKYKLGGSIDLTAGMHIHPNGAFGYRIECHGAVVVYITDVEHYPDRLDVRNVELAKGADLLIHDSQYTPEELPSKRGWGHSSWEQSVRVAQEAGVKDLILFHHDPDRTDDELREIEKKAQREFKNAHLAREGLEIEIQEKS